MADDDEAAPALPVPGFGPDETPSFGDVVKAFTPPGTDFEEFKKALHSQGAPGRVSPEFVSMLNKAAVAGAIPGDALKDTGPRCVRCDHPHGGTPGPKCLEAELHLGRSPFRRRPDLQLDEISAKRSGQVQPANAPQPSMASEPPQPIPGRAPASLPEPDFPPGMPSVSAVAAHEQYVDLRRGGFTRSEALELLANLIAKAQPDNSSTDEN